MTYISDDISIMKSHDPMKYFNGIVGQSFKILNISDLILILNIWFMIFIIMRVMWTLRQILSFGRKYPISKNIYLVNCLSLHLRPGFLPFM